jgi:hypothetical protein
MSFSRIREPSRRQMKWPRVDRVERDYLVRHIFITKHPDETWSAWTNVGPLGFNGTGGSQNEALAEMFRTAVDWLENG